MAYHSGLLKAATALAALGLIAGCGQQATTSAGVTKTADCVPVDDGGNYTIVNGKFVSASAPAERIVERVVVEQAERPWYETVEATFPDKGYGFMGLNVRRNTATLIGLAPDAETKTAAFAAGKAAIEARSESEGYNIINGISVEGGERGVGAALAELDDAPTLDACQKAFRDTMQNRNVQFGLGSANILPASAQLLDAVSGVASLCSAYKIEIGGHTDSDGAAASNLALSQRRATSVRAYLQNRGVDVSGLTAVGYGETRPIDTSGTAAGNAINRRTEFTVSE